MVVSWFLFVSLAHVFVLVFALVFTLINLPASPTLALAYYLRFGF